MRRAFFWIMLASVVVLPVWLMLGRGLFGAPLGSALVAQAFLAPLLAVLIAAVVGLTIARKEVRTPRRATWHDVRLVGPWLVATALLALLVVDEAGGVQGSALTALFGADALTASNALAAVLTFAIIVGAVVIGITQLVLLGRETRTRVVTWANSAGMIAQRPVEAEAIFERVDRPQRGESITIDADDDRR